jgi:HlyD family secretion protein
MHRRFLWCLVALGLPLTGSGPARVVRSTGTVQAVNSVSVQTPSIRGQGGNLTLIRLIANGAVVHKGDVLAEFDATGELKSLREAEAKFDDLSHQVEQKRAEHQNNAEKRASELQQAGADLEKATIETRRGPVLSEIEEQKNLVKLDDAKVHVESLKRSNKSHDVAEEAEIRVLELQRDRQKLAVERARDNSTKLTVRSPLNGMAALENVWRNGSFGHAQEGDQLWPGSALLRVFDPSTMEVEVSVGEPDGAVLVPGSKAVVRLDAFPELTFTAHFDSASPIAVAGADIPIKTFMARFRLDQSDPHLLPDLSAAVDIQPR